MPRLRIVKTWNLGKGSKNIKELAKPGAYVDVKPLECGSQKWTQENISQLGLSSSQNSSLGSSTESDMEHEPARDNGEEEEEDACKSCPGGGNSNNNRQINIDYQQMLRNSGNNVRNVNATANDQRYDKSTRVPATKPQVRLARRLTFPFAWLTHKTVGMTPLDKIAILTKHLPRLYEVPEDERSVVLHFACKHAFQLLDGRLVVSQLDLEHCKDSKKWFRQRRKELFGKDGTLPALVPLELDARVIAEIDGLSAKAFGRTLKKCWERGKARAYEELQYEKRIRGMHS